MDPEERAGEDVNPLSNDRAPLEKLFSKVHVSNTRPAGRIWPARPFVCGYYTSPAAAAIPWYLSLHFMSSWQQRGGHNPYRSCTSVQSPYVSTSPVLSIHQTLSADSSPLVLLQDPTPFASQLSSYLLTGSSTRQGGAL